MHKGLPTSGKPLNCASRATMRATASAHGRRENGIAAVLRKTTMVTASSLTWRTGADSHAAAAVLLA